MAGVSLAGPKKELSGDVCQDHHQMAATSNNWLVAVASDGAGSAPFGGEGARLVCHELVCALTKVLEADQQITCSRAALLRIRRCVCRAILRARSAAIECTEEKEAHLSQFHATVIGVVSHPKIGGVFFHIGDGAAIAVDTKESHAVISPPENGEFADTTFFYTEPHWKKHLRFTHFQGSFDTIFLMSDGVSDMALTRKAAEFSPYFGFLSPVARYLASHSREIGEAGLRATLQTEDAKAHSSDDKTVVWATTASVNE